MTKLEPRSRLVSRELLLYALIGGSGVLLDYLLFLLLFNVFGLHHQLANAISTTAGITNNFVLNSLFNFRKTDRIVVRFLRFYAVGIAGIGLTFLLLAVFSTWLGIDANLVKLASLPLVLLFQYTINKRWSFG
ncbi:GtrA family protein [Saccharopolyspora rhizosphaerae]|uniref:GtrA family protein n=1 Tax=Saccharopolyspora rhizosphaerae TaxID=2492662 RepID=A0A3R8NXL3_9PSEU|nr:GtrA family protein [Saccharopolyspora rhizosphaerae]RRO15155.1 GtrA family protein [Saccharopolyspora rhizosphaerae]